MWAKIRDKPKIKDMRGVVTTYITVLYRLHNYKKGDRHSHWLCKCNCGNLITLAQNNIHKSKGCRKCAFTGINKTHGKKNTRIYRIWRCMKQRCYDCNIPNYKNYGGRGITMCDEWKNSFPSFYNWATTNGYNDTLTIDRIDVNGNYEPSNCRWVDYKTQANNKRNNIYITTQQGIMSLKQACRLYDKNYKRELRKYHRMSKLDYEQKFIL